MVLAVIPARYASTRFPGKPLAQLGGQTMISRVYGQVSSSSLVDETIVATDDQRIFDHVEEFGGRAVMTRADHPSGTDRVAEAAARFPSATIVVNVQGDEPFIDPNQIDQLVTTFSDASVDIATLAHPVSDERSLLSPNVVKVVRDRKGKALYFSRHAIPFLRDVPIGQWLQHGKHLQHLGLYAYRAEILPNLGDLPQSELEGLESLEQLRWLEHGLSIHVGITNTPSRGIDTPDDLAKAENWLRERKK